MPFFEKSLRGNTESNQEPKTLKQLKEKLEKQLENPKNSQIATNIKTVIKDINFIIEKQQN